MSPQRRQHRQMASLIVLLIVSVGALVLSVWLVGRHAANGVRASESRARREQVQRDASARAAQTVTLRAGCARGVARDFELYGTNRDLAGYARDASRVWRANGRRDVARKYAARAQDAEFRMARIGVRLPHGEDAASVRAYCVRLYPDPR